MTDMKASDRRRGLASPIVVACKDIRAHCDATGFSSLDLECPTHGTESKRYNTAHETS